MAYVRQEKYEEALPALVRVVELGGGDGLTYGLLGYAHSTVGNSIAAESAYRMASLLEPDVRDWKRGMVRSFFRQQRYAEAVALTKHLLEVNPDDEQLWLLQANAYIGQDKPLDAAKNYEVVDDMGGSSFDTLAMLGDIYVNEELFELAVDAYARALKEDADKGAKRAIRAARVMASRGELELAGEMAVRIEEIRGEKLSKDQRTQLLKIRARVASAAGAGENEAEILQQIVRIDPLDGEALLLLGQYYADQGQVAKAINRYEQAAGIKDFQADAKVRHAQLLVRESRYAEALPLLREAQKLEYRENVQQYLEQVEAVARSR